MSCKKKVYQAVKLNTVDGTVETVGDPFDFIGETVDPATLVDCPEIQYVTNSVCVTTDGEDCLEGVKQLCQITYDCATQVATPEVLGYVLPDSTFTAAADIAEPFAVIPCPVFQIVENEKCAAPTGGGEKEGLTASKKAARKSDAKK